MKFGKICERKGLLVMGMVWLSMTIMLSSAATENVDNPSGMPVCWAKIDNCQKAQTGFDLLNSEAFSPMCCPVLKQQMKDTACFCSFKSYILSLPIESSSTTVVSSAVDVLVNKMLLDCKVNGNFEDMCKGVKSGANMLASVGILPVLVSILAMVASQ